MQIIDHRMNPCAQPTARLPDIQVSPCVPPPAAHHSERATLLSLVKKSKSLSPPTAYRLFCQRAASHRRLTQQRPMYRLSGSTGKSPRQWTAHA